MLPVHGLWIGNFAGIQNLVYLQLISGSVPQLGQSCSIDLDLKDLLAVTCARLWLQSLLQIVHGTTTQFSVCTHVHVSSATSAACMK